MRIVGLCFVLMALAGAALVAQTRTYERLVIADAAVGLASATLQPPGQAAVTRCTGRLEDAQVRVSDARAITVSATTGRIIEIGDLVELTTPSDAASVRFAKTGSTTGVLYLECGT